MLQAMLAGVASIKAQQTRMNVIGDNLANVNTTAYKGSRVTFQDMIAQTIKGAAGPNGSLGGTNPVQFGLGVLVAGTDIDNTQGSLNATNRPTDLAIQGSGYYLVSDGQQVSYTRDGAFGLDSVGDVVHSATGERLLGWTADAFGKIDTSKPIDNKSTLNIPLGRLNAVQQTTQMTLQGNLDSTAAATATATTDLRVYDSLGGAHDIVVTYTNHQSPPPAVPTPPAGAVSSWDWSASENGVNIGSSATAGNETLDFDTNGKVVSGLAAGVLNQITVPTNGTAPAFNIGIDMSAIGQLAIGSQIAPKDQNGFPPGSLQGYSIGTDGVVTGLFTNGLTRPIGQIAMSIFPNPDGLQRLGNNLWLNSDNSGIPNTGTARTGGRGAISSGFLEQSNIDIGSQFTDLIITQRGFQANTKVVTTVDEMLQDLIQMKH